MKGSLTLWDHSLLYIAFSIIELSGKNEQKMKFLGRGVGHLPKRSLNQFIDRPKLPTCLVDKNLYCQKLPKEGRETSGEGSRIVSGPLRHGATAGGKEKHSSFEETPFPGPSLLFPLPPFLPTESLAPGIHLLTSPIATIP